MNAEALRDALLVTLAEIRTLTPADRAAWEADRVRRLAIERLWIIAGNTAEAYRVAAGLPSGVDPWAELYGFRSVLAHALRGDLSTERIWHETTVDLPRLVAEVQNAKL